MAAFAAGAVVDGAAHVHLCNARPEAWRTTVIAFLDRYLVR
jgi:hypothetical protein